MKITIDKASFVDAVKWTLAGVDANNGSSTIHLDVKDSTEIELSASSPSGERSYTFPAVIDDYDEGTVFDLLASDLKKLPSQITSQDVTIEYNDKKSRSEIFVNVGVKLKLSLFASSVLTAKGTKGMTLLGNLVPADLFSAVSKLVISTDQKAADSRLSALDFKTDGKGTLTIVGLDTYNVSLREIQYNADSTEEARFLLPASEISNMSSAKNTLSVDVYENKSSVLFSFDDGHVARVNKEMADPIAYEGLLYGDREDLHVDANTADLLSAVNRLAAWTTDEDDLSFTIDPSNSKLTVHSQSGDWSESVAIENADMGDEPLDVNFPKTVISKALRSVDSDTVRIRFKRGPEDIRDSVFIFDQIDGNNEPDKTVYIMCTPTIEE
mgnify:FL=1